MDNIYEVCSVKNAVGVSTTYCVIDITKIKRAKFNTLSEFEKSRRCEYATCDKELAEEYCQAMNELYELNRG